MSANNPRLRAALIAATLAAPLLAGCRHEPAPPNPSDPVLHCPALPDAPFAVAVGARANAAVPQLTGALDNRLQDAAHNGQRVTFVRVDGRPEQAYTDTYRVTSVSSGGKNQDWNDFYSRLQTAFSATTKAARPEADLLGALAVAGRATGGAPGATARGTVVVADSGLQTVAPLRFQDDGGSLLLADPADVVAGLKKAELLPDLTGRTVVFTGLGNTADPQPALDARLHRRLIAIWTAIVNASGAGCIDVLDEPAYPKSVRGTLPAVAVVPLPAPPTPPKPCGETVLGEANDVGFVAESDQFRDPEAARATIGTVAATMRAGRQTAELIGTTANVGDLSGQVRLSAKRAVAVARVLSENGIGADRIHSTGQGSRFDGYVTDHGPSGELLPGPAARNRKVIVRLSCPAT